MSYIDLSEAKDFLNVIHNGDDLKLQRLLDAAEKQALNFMNRTQFGEICEEDSNFDPTEETMPNDVWTGVMYYLQAAYDATPQDIKILHDAARALLMPYRCAMGI